MEEGAGSFFIQTREPGSCREQDRRAGSHSVLWSPFLLVYVLLSLALSVQPPSRLAPRWPGLST